MATPIIPNLDNSNTGYAFNTVTTPENYYNTDFNFPVAEFTAKLEDDILTKLVNIINLIYHTSYTLENFKNTGPSDDCISMYNLIKDVTGYKRLLYNYALPLINLSILMSKVDIVNLTNPNLLQTIYPTYDNLYNFMHSAIKKLFDIMICEGRTYNEMSLQMFGATHGDGLDDENKLSRLVDFWNNVFYRSSDDKLFFDKLYQTYLTSTNFLLKYKMNMTITGTQLTRQNINLAINADIITYFEEFTLPNLNIDAVTNELNSINVNSTNFDVIKTLKSISAGYYDTIQNESVISPVNPVIFRNCYSLNPTFSYADFKEVPPVRAVTYGDYLLLLLYKLMPTLFTNYVNAPLITTKFIYNDIVTIVSVFKLSVVGTDPLPTMTGFDCQTLFGTTVFNKLFNDIFTDIKFIYNGDIVACLLELFDYVPKSSKLSFVDIIVVTATVDEVINFYNPEAISDLFTNNTLRHSLFKNKTASYNMSMSAVKTTTPNQLIGLTIFSLLAQQYSNKNINIFNNKEYIRGLFDSNGSSFFTLTGNLLIMVKATLILMDRVYCYFFNSFSKDTMATFSGKFIETSGTDVSIIRKLLGIETIPDLTFDPIDYMGYLSFSYLVIYNYDFVRELTQDLICNFVLDNSGSLVSSGDDSLTSRVNDLERKLNYLVTGNGAFIAANSFNAYKHNTISTQI